MYDRKDISTQKIPDEEMGVSPSGAIDTLYPLCLVKRRKRIASCLGKLLKI